MPQITTTEWNSVTDGGFPRSSKLLIQNRSDVPIFFDTAPGDVADTGMEILAGATYEVPSRPHSLNLATASGTAADVRVVRL
jgi:hypothetical protein